MVPLRAVWRAIANRIVREGFFTANGENLSRGPSPTGRGWREAPGEGFLLLEHPSSGPSDHLLPVGEGHAITGQEELVAGEP
jgi:hypothetical protein